MRKCTKLWLLMAVFVLTSAVVFAQNANTTTAKKATTEAALQLKAISQPVPYSNTADIAGGVNPNPVGGNTSTYKWSDPDPTDAVLYDNGPVITTPGGGFGGADLSALETAIGLTIFGFGCQVSASNSMADDFVVSGGSWTINDIRFYSYQTGATSVTINDVRVQIWNGQPNAGGAVIWGDMTTNRLSTATFTNIYRAADTAPTGNTRRLVDVVANTTGLVLAPGTYWVQVMIGGSGASGPWMPPISILGTTTTGNGLQQTGGTTWQNAISGTWQQGVPFIIEGTAGTFANDVGVDAIISPADAGVLGLQNVTITVKNFGTSSQSNIPVKYTWMGTDYNGIVPGPIAGGASVNYTFPTQINVMSWGSHTISATTMLVGDQVPGNDAKTKNFTVLPTPVTVYPQNAAYWTGTCSPTAKTQTSLIYGYGTEVGWAKFDISAIPANSSIISAEFHGYLYDNSWPYWSITSLPYDPVTAAASDINNWVSSNYDPGYSYNTESGTLPNNAYLVRNLSGTAAADLQAATAQGWFAVGIVDWDFSTSYYVRFQGWAEANKPYLTITYAPPVDHDVLTQSIDVPGVFQTPGVVAPKATVKNNGANVETFNVTCTITGGYSSTKTVTNLGVGATQQVTFDNWNATIGNYTVDVCTQLGTDMVPTNDCAQRLTTVADMIQVYGYSAYDPSAVLPEGPVTFFLQQPGTITSLAATTSAQFIAGGAWANLTGGDVWFGAEYYDGSTGGGLWTINPANGAMTNVGSLVSTGGFNGLTYDPVGGLLYGHSYDGVSNCTLYSVDPYTYAPTMIGDMGAHLFINLACDATGQLYAIDLLDDILYTVNKATGAVTAVGPTGFAFNYAQDMEFDNNNNALYAAAYTTMGELLSINPATGAATSLGQFQGSAEICGFAIPYTPFTGIEVDLTAFLEGPYNATSNAMNIFLNTGGVIPLAQPYNPALPYFGNNNPTWLYAGTESVAAIPANVVDWVLVEIRDAASAAAATGATIEAQQACFVMADGSIVDINGNVPVFAVTIDNGVFAVVKHRNHLAIMNAAPLVEAGGVYTYDFSTAATQVYGGTVGYKQVDAAPVRWALIAADGNADMQVNTNDKLNVWKIQSGGAGYLAGDFSLDGQCNTQDKLNVWKPNSGKSTQVPN